MISPVCFPSAVPFGIIRWGSGRLRWSGIRRRRLGRVGNERMKLRTDLVGPDCVILHPSRETPHLAKISARWLRLVSKRYDTIVWYNGMIQLYNTIDWYKVAIQLRRLWYCSQACWCPKQQSKDSFLVANLYSISSKGIIKIVKPLSTFLSEAL